MGKCLIIVGRDFGLYNQCHFDDVMFCDYYKRQLPSLCLRLLRNTNLFIGLITGISKEKLLDYEFVIMFDAEATFEYLYWVRRKMVSGSRLVLYFRNKISTHKKRMLVDKARKAGIELWTYNSLDAIEYNMKYNKQFVLKKIISDFSCNGREIYDVVFVGYAKGREKLINKISCILARNKMRYFFYVPDIRSDWNGCKDGKGISYYEYLKILNEARCVLDIVNEYNYGLTTRPLEALALGKKVLTNYSDIKNHDFYSKTNFFIFDDNLDFRQLKAFLDDDSVDMREYIFINYDMKNWIDSFGG